MIPYLRAMNRTITSPPQPPRYYNGGYRYFFNGQEADNEVLGECGLAGYEFRQYDTRLGRWWGVDRKQTAYVGFSPFIHSLDNPISLLDENGKWVRDQNGNIIVCYSKRLNWEKTESYTPITIKHEQSGRTEYYTIEGQWGYIMSNNGTKVEVFIPNSTTIKHVILDADGMIIKSEELSEGFDPSKNCTTNSLLPNIPNILISSDQITEEILCAEGYIEGSEIEADLMAAAQSGDPAASNKSIRTMTQAGDIVTYTDKDGRFEHFEIFTSVNRVDTKAGFEKGPVYRAPMSNEFFKGERMIWFNLNVNGWQDVVKTIASQYSTGTAPGLIFVDEKYFNKLRDEISH